MDVTFIRRPERCTIPHRYKIVDGNGTIRCGICGAPYDGNGRIEGPNDVTQTSCYPLSFTMEFLPGGPAHRMTNEEYKKAIEEFDPSDAKRFHELLRHGIDTYGVTFVEMKRACKTSEGSVSRWYHGYTTPADLVRTIVLRYLWSRVR